jgi:tetratricopeptide (TPR) repeat protein
MKRMLITLLVTAALTAPALANPVNDCMKGQGEEMIRGCTTLIMQRKYSGHDLSVIYNNRGVAYGQAGDHEKSIVDLNEALRHDRRNALARKNRMRALAALGRFGEAIKDADVLIQLAPTADSYLRRADLHEHNGSIEEAVADLDTAIKKQPGVAQYYADRGRLLSLMSWHEKAIEDLSRAIQLNPRNPSNYFARGLTWAHAGKCDQGILDYTKAIELSPRYSAALNNRGVCRQRGGQHDEAISDYEQAIKLEPGNEKAKQNLANMRSRPALMPVPDADDSRVAPNFTLPPVRELLAVPEFKIDEKK